MKNKTKVKQKHLQAGRLWYYSNCNFQWPFASLASIPAIGTPECSTWSNTRTQALATCMFFRLLRRLVNPVPGMHRDRAADKEAERVLALTVNSLLSGSLL